MSQPNPIAIPASSPFLDLCQAQVKLLIQGLGAAWCAVYITEELADNVPNLMPVLVYPEESALWQSRRVAPYRVNPKRLLAAALPAERSEFFPGVDFPQERERALNETALNQDYQIVLPLIYQQSVMGLLVTGRKERKWKKRELTQIEQIARTLAIACLLERRQGWYRRQLHQQTQFRRAQPQILDDWLHQIRNPLTAVRTFGKLLLKRFLPEDRNREIAQSILRESDRLQDFLEQFDDYIDSLEDEIATLPPPTVHQLPPTEEDRLETVATTALAPLPLLRAGETLHLEPLDLLTLLEPLVLSADAIATERGLTLHLQIPPKLPPVQADPRALREVLSNLLDNALKYTPTGGQVRLETRLDQPQMLGVVVSDTGLGIPLEDQQRLFERHYRGVQARGDIPGTGLGLALAKEWIEHMQGKIEVISPAIPDRANLTLRGTTFIVWLPLAHAELT